MDAIGLDAADFVVALADEEADVGGFSASFSVADGREAVGVLAIDVDDDPEGFDSAVA